MAKIIIKKGISCLSLAVFINENSSGKFSIRLECCWHLDGVFRICLQLKSLKKLLLISGSHSELGHEVWRDAQCWSLRETQIAVAVQLPKVL